MFNTTKAAHFLLAIYLFLTCGVASAQSRYFMTVADTKKGAEGFVASIAAGNSDGAIKQLRAMSILAPQQLDVFEAQFNSQALDVIRRFGDSLDYEWLSTDELGSRLIRHQFVVNYARAPIRWVFVFYRSPAGWTLNDFRFDGTSLEFFNSPTGMPRQQ